MKKLLVLFLALSLSTGMLTACGPKAPAEDLPEDPAISEEAPETPDAPAEEEGDSVDMTDLEPADKIELVPEEPAEKPAAEPKPQPKPDPKPEKPAEKPADKPAAGVSVEDLSAAVEGAMGEMGAMMALSADELSQLYGITGVSEFIVKVPMMNVNATEYAIFKTSDVQAVKDGIAKRQADLIATWEMYLPAQFELVQNAQTVVNGEYVLFVVAENADAIVEAFNGLTK